MLEIFIPTEIKWYLEINVIRNKFLDILENSFQKLKIKKFNSTFFSWIKIESDIFIEDLIILCNWEFWEFYFIDYDFTKDIFEYLWTKIIWENKIEKKIEGIMLNIDFITWELTSTKLLTNTKKQEIKQKIDSSLFSLSWVIFLLYTLRNKTIENIWELDNYKWKVDLEWQAKLLWELSLTKEIELQAGIDKLEWKIELYILTLRRFVLYDK
jgi:hypothetical protein